MPIRWRRLLSCASGLRTRRRVPADRLAVDGDLALLERLQEIDAGKQRALARAARPDDGHDLAARHVEVDAPEHLGVAEALVDVPCI